VDTSTLPAAWQEAFRRDRESKPPFPDPLPERRLARLLAAFILSGLFFMAAPGTLLGVWNLLGISSRRELAAISTAWIQAHGHAQFFGWVGSFIIGISLYTLPKFRGAATRSIPLGWAMWAIWSAAVALRWIAGVQSTVHPNSFRASAGCELLVAALLLWQCSAPPRSQRQPRLWVAPVFTGFAGLLAALAWQLWLTLRPFTAPALPAAEDRTLISLAIWMFAYPMVLGYSIKFFPGLLGTAAADAGALRVALLLLAPAAAGFVLGWNVFAAAATTWSVALAWCCLRLFEATAGKPKLTGVYARYPQFSRMAYLWVGVASLLGFGVARPGMLGASRHAFTVGFLATLIFSIGPRILPSFLNSRELWSPRLMRWSLLLITAGCTLRVICEPLAYGGIFEPAWKILPVSALAELTAVVLFGMNLAMSLATPVPSWFGRKQVNDRMSVYWLISSYPGTRRLLIENGLVTLARAGTVPKSLSLREAALADGADPQGLVERLGTFFEARLAKSLRAAEMRPKKQTEVL
jgi:hypothetical protein